MTAQQSWGFTILPRLDCWIGRTGDVVSAEYLPPIRRYGRLRIAQRQAPWHVPRAEKPPRPAAMAARTRCAGTAAPRRRGASSPNATARSPEPDVPPVSSIARPFTPMRAPVAAQSSQRRAGSARASAATSAPGEGTSAANASSPSCGQAPSRQPTARATHAFATREAPLAGHGPPPGMSRLRP